MITGEAGFSFGPAVGRVRPLARPWEAVAAKFSSGERGFFGGSIHGLVRGLGGELFGGNFGEVCRG